MVRLLHFSFSLARFSHLPVPSENVGPRSKKTVPQTTGDLRVTAGAKQ